MTGFILLLLAIAGSLFWLYKGGFTYIKKIQTKKKKKDSFDWNKVTGRDSWDESLYDEIF